MSKSKVAIKESPLVAAELVTEAEYRRILLSEMRKSPDNRKRFDDAALTELGASIKAMGVVQPILVRPVTPTAELPEIYEIVAGERRYRGSIIAGVLDIPAMVRVLTDLEAAKIRILENLQREDPHPMEEAEGYQLLMLQHGYNADQLAEEIKKSRAYVYGRLKLCALSTEVREQFLDNKVSASTALLIARIPVPALQAKALDDIQRPYGNMTSEPLSHRKAMEHLQARYMLDLNKAVFKITDARLLASAGACGPCIKRTGNQPEVFDGISADVCTDPECFGEKRAAHHAALVVQANKKGIPIAEGKERDAIQDNRWSADSDLVKADTHVSRFARNAPSTKNVGTASDYLGDDALPKVATYTKEPDGLCAWYKRSDMQAALEAAGACESVEQHAARMTAAPSPAADEKPKHKTAEDIVWERTLVEARQETEFRVALYKKLRGSGEAKGFSLESLREFTKLAVRNHALPDDLLGDVYSFDTSSDDAVCAYVDGAGLPAIQLLLIDLLVGESLEVDAYTVKRQGHLVDDFSTVGAMARHEGIDPDVVREELFPTPINVDAATQDTLRAFIRKHPHRIHELTIEALGHKRGEVVHMLERAANELGYVYAGGSFQVEPPPAAAPIEICPSLSATIVDEAATGAADGEFLEEMMADPAPTVKPQKGKSAGKKVTLAPASAWPFPKSSTAARETTATDNAPQETTQEVPA